jgi:hypothetical protein
MIRILLKSIPLHSSAFNVGTRNHYDSLNRGEENILVLIHSLVNDKKDCQEFIFL